MTKRPKLSLSQHQETTVKKRPSAFGVPPSPAPRPVRTAQKNQSTKPVTPPADRAISTAETQQQSPVWLNAGRIAKTLLVVGATALSIYLLKRRLF